MDRPAANVKWQTAINLEAKTCSPKTLKNAWGLIKSALKENGITPNVVLPSVGKTPMPWLTPEQIPIFLEAVKGKSCELPALLGLCSLRRSEIFGLDWSDIDLEKKVIHVHAATVMSEDGPVHKKTTKTNASTRTVPIIIPRLTELLTAAEDKNGPVCTCFIGTPYHQIINVCKAAGLPEVGMHGLRRSFASLGYHLGLSELEIMSIGAWNDFQTVHEFYLYLSEADRQKSADKLTSFFSNCL